MMRFLGVVALSVLISAPALAASKTVRDWTGTCDDYSCTAEVTGAGGLAMGGQGYRLQIARSNDPSAAWYVKLLASKVPQPGEKATITIDENAPVETSFLADALGEGFDISDQASLERIFPMLRAGQKVRIAFGDNSEEFSLSGIAAVLLWIDDQQKRVGNSDQVAAIAPATDMGTIGEDEAKALRAQLSGMSVVNECQWFGAEGREESFYAQSFALDGDHQMFLIQCMMGAYQPSTLVFIKSYDRLEPQAFADYSPETGWGGSLYLGFADFDPKTLELSDYVKGRGLGDCGSSARYRWTGYDFKLLEYRFRACSDEALDDEDGEIPEFPVIYESK